MSKKVNPGTFIAMAVLGAIFSLVIHWWVILLLGLSFLMYLGMYDYEKQKRDARKMRAELRMDARRALADEYRRRHPDRA